MNMVSIIVPIYNAEKYIEACLDSILKQTYQHYEVILVDDGSSDNSGKICDYFAMKDVRITVYHRVNAGVSSSRNFGIDQANGKYIMFVDADDTIEPDMLEDCIQLAENNEAELVIFSLRYYITDDQNRMVENSLENEVCVTEQELFKHWFSVLAEKEILNPPWNKFIKKELLDTNHIRFREEFSICEDMMLSVELLGASKKTVLTGNMYYNYYIRSSGNLLVKFHENYFEAVNYFYTHTYAYCLKFENSSKQLKVLNTIYVNLVIYHLQQICMKSNWDKKTKYNKMNEIGKSKEFHLAFKSVSLNRKKKLVFYLLRNGQFFLIHIMFLFKSIKIRKW